MLLGAGELGKKAVIALQPLGIELARPHSGGRRDISFLHDISRQPDLNNAPNSPSPN
jgi:hypothetical protein